MANLDIIYRIAADISGLKGSIDQGVATMGRMESLAGTLGRSLAGAFTVTAIAGFVRDAVQAADRIQRLSDVTGIGAEALTKLEFAANQSGNTLEQVTNAISQMQNRLASGDQSAVGALTQLNLSLDELRALSPDQQFIEIASAVARIEDPARRVQVAMDLFGRSGAQILPTLISDVKRLGDEFQGMSDRTTEVLDGLGDKFDALKARAANAGRTFLASLFDATVAAEAHQKAVEASALASGNMPPVVPDAPKQTLELRTLTLTLEQERQAIAKLDAELKKLNATRETARQNAEEMERHFRRLWDSVDRGGGALANIGQSIDGDFNNPIREAIAEAAFMDNHMRRLWDSVDRGGSSLAHIGQSFGKLGDDLVKSTKSFGTHLKELFENVPRKMGEMQESIAGMLTGFFGGGGTMHSIMSAGLNLIFGPASGLLVSLAMQGIQAMAGVIADGLTWLGKKLADFFSWAWNGIKAIFGGGGQEDPSHPSNAGGLPPPGEPGRPDIPHVPDIPHQPRDRFFALGTGGATDSGISSLDQYIRSYLKDDIAHAVRDALVGVGG